MEDFDIPQNKLAESAERVVDRALEEARRREHALLTNEHVCLAFAQMEWDMFGQVMRDLELNPHEILQAVEEHLRLLPSVPGRELRVAPSTKLLFKLALLHASRWRRICSRRSSRKRRGSPSRSSAVTVSSRRRSSPA